MPDIDATIPLMAGKGNAPPMNFLEMA
jgi:hypothetical protein